MGEATPTVIGCDVGTSAVKAAVFAPGGRRGPVVVRPVTTRTAADGSSTQDPVELRRAVLGALGDVVAAADRPPDALALSAAMHALVGLGVDGDPVTPLLTWADSRATPVAGAWRANGVADFLHDRTGVPVHPMAPVTKLAWFADVDPATADSVARWVDLKGLVTGWLTGDAVTEVSSASGWGLLDIRTLAWDAEAVGTARVDPGRLPVVEASTAIRPLAPVIAGELGLAAGTPVVLGAADGPLGNVGVGATSRGVAGLSLGTSGAVRVVVEAVPSPIPDGLFCYALGDRRWVLGGAVSNGGNTVDWLADVFVDGPPPAESSAAVGDDRAGRIAAVLAAAATAPPGADGLVMVPYLVAERAPLWDPDLPGAYLGLRRHHTRAHLARAAMEGVCAGLGVIVDRIAAVEPVDEVRATGGALDSSLWRSMVAAATARPTVVDGTADGSALGAAALGFVALGAADDVETARRMIVGDGRDGSSRIVVSDDMVVAARATRTTISSRARQLAAIAGYDADPPAASGR